MGKGWVVRGFVADRLDLRDLRHLPVPCPLVKPVRHAPEVGARSGPIPHQLREELEELIGRLHRLSAALIRLVPFGSPQRPLVLRVALLLPLLALWGLARAAFVLSRLVRGLPLGVLVDQHRVLQELVRAKRVARPDPLTSPGATDASAPLLRGASPDSCQAGPVVLQRVEHTRQREVHDLEEPAQPRLQLQIAPVRLLGPLVADELQVPDLERLALSDPDHALLARKLRVE